MFIGVFMGKLLAIYLLILADSGYKTSYRYLTYDSDSFQYAKQPELRADSN